MNAQLEAPAVPRKRPNWDVVAEANDRLAALESALAASESRAADGWEHYRSERLTADRMLDYATRQLRERLAQEAHVADLESRIVGYTKWQPWIFAFGLFLGAVGEAAVRAWVAGGFQ